MELLTYVAQASKRRPRFEEAAVDLATGHDSIQSLEDTMSERQQALTKRLSRGKMRFTEFERAAADGTIIAALGGVMLGDKETGMKDQVFAQTMKTMPYLWEFYREILWSLNEGKLEYLDGEDDEPPVSSASGKSPTKYALTSRGVNDILAEDIIDTMPKRQPELGKSRPASWEGVGARLNNYMATPVYSWYTFGVMDKNRRLGLKQCRRICLDDRASCEVCKEYARMGWQNMGILPVPGERCTCLFNCRCAVEYR